MNRDQPPVDVTERVRETLAADQRVFAAYLFGSVARGTASSDSDLDIAIPFAEPINGRFGGQLDQLRDAIERASAQETRDATP